jgi:CRP-like cAMP-binding protein
MSLIYTPPTLSEVLNRGHRHQVPKGQIMPSLFKDLGVAKVEKGYIKRYLITQEGNQSIQIIYGPNNVFPLTPVFKELLDFELYEGKEIFYYEAMSPAMIRTVSMTELKQAAAADAKLYEDLLYIAGLRLNYVIAELETMSMGNVYQKIAHQLLYLADHYGERNGQSAKILVPLSTGDLAGILNVTRETISRNLSRLQRKDLISTGKNILIPDIEKLRKEINK